MKLKFKACMAGSDFVWKIDSVHDVEESEAKRLIDAGYAEEVKSAKPAKAVKAPRKKKIETATEL